MDIESSCDRYHQDANRQTAAPEPTLACLRASGGAFQNGMSVLLGPRRGPPRTAREQ